MHLNCSSMPEIRSTGPRAALLTCWSLPRARQMAPLPAQRRRSGRRYHCRKYAVPAERRPRRWQRRAATATAAAVAAAHIEEGAFNCLPQLRVGICGGGGGGGGGAAAASGAPRAPQWAPAKPVVLLTRSLPPCSAASVNILARFNCCSARISKFCL